MRIFQNSGISESYAIRLRSLVGDGLNFSQQRDVFLADRYGAPHILEPVYAGDTSSFFTNGNDPILQRAWANEKGMPRNTNREQILLAQIEESRPDLFYNLDPHGFDSSFVKKIPQFVKSKIAWRAAPGKIDLSAYDFVVSNFPFIRKQYEKSGIRTAELFPSHDPKLEPFASNRDRDIDVLFIGTFSRHHVARAQYLETIAKAAKNIKVVLHLQSSRFGWIANTPLGWFGPLANMRIPPHVRAVAKPAVFGMAMYEALGRAKVVFNGAIEMGGPDRGNMRCFEAMGAGACLITDAGNYPAGMRDGQTMLCYDDHASFERKVREALEGGLHEQVALAGHAMVRETYSKRRQLNDLLALV